MSVCVCVLRLLALLHVAACYQSSMGVGSMGGSCSCGPPLTRASFTIICLSMCLSSLGPPLIYTAASLELGINLFAMTYEHPHDWRLRIRFVQHRDEGTYQCQVSTHPPLTRTVHMHVVEAAMHILDERGVLLREKFYHTGSTIELQCRVSNVPIATALQLTWYRGRQRLNYDASRGGVSVKTELRGSVAHSWLRVGNAVKEDSGTYYCNVTHLAATSVNIHVVPEKHPAAIQAGGRSPLTPPSPFWQHLLTHSPTRTRSRTPCPPPPTDNPPAVCVCACVCVCVCRYVFMCVFS
ncbi:uncharacterized protein LOC135095638 [Scylla paramamosain]|uniref:uncharacterized protein LOC135095638 n=1 Tax=Scylla paramamosain TaxID=85552 RepID=UPI00308272EC